MQAKTKLRRRAAQNVLYDNIVEQKEVVVCHRIGAFYLSSIFVKPRFEPSLRGLVDFDQNRWGLIVGPRLGLLDYFQIRLSIPIVCIG